jgi:hypothetical protein
MSSASQMAHPMIRGDQVWCPSCKQYVDLLRIRRAAKIADVSFQNHLCRIVGRAIRKTNSLSRS